MWELIASNKRKSILLFFFMGFLLAFLGFSFQLYFFPESNGALGLLFAFVLWLILSLISYFSGRSILLFSAGAKKVTPDINRRLFNIVEEMTIAAGINKMPDIYIIDDDSPNAFAVGRTPEKSAVAVTTGLLYQLRREELQGVIAHEISHIINRDTLFLTFAGVMLGAIVLISNIFSRSLSIGSSRRYSSRSGGNAGAVLFIVTLLFAILSPILARLIYFAISRQREYLADISAVRLTRYPDGLASALEKISGAAQPMQNVNRVTAGMFIVNPLELASSFSGWFSTHPKIEDRIRILKNISAGKPIQTDSVLPSLAKKYLGTYLTEINSTGGFVNFSSELAPEDEEIIHTKTLQEKRTVGDFIMRQNHFRFYDCNCGLKLKIPPQFKQNSFDCPKCGKLINLKH